jgi:hypothetical protein
MPRILSIIEKKARRNCRIKNKAPKMGKEYLETWKIN